MMINKAYILLVSILSFSCSLNKEFEVNDKREEYTFLHVSESNSQNVELIVFRINDKPTSFWRINESFKIPLGYIKIKLIADSEPYEYETLRFKVQSNHKYEIRTSENGIFAEIYEINNVTGKSRLLIKGKRK